MFHASIVRYSGAEEIRTPDLRIANATLSQLSYRPDLFQLVYFNQKDRQATLQLTIKKNTTLSTSLL